jgi:hypothetical protein
MEAVCWLNLNKAFPRSAITTATLRCKTWRSVHSVMNIMIHVIYADIQEVDEIKETLWNWGIEYIRFGCNERTSVGNTKCSSVCLQSVVLVSVH